jgi:hypothetical protein
MREVMQGNGNYEAHRLPVGKTVAEMRISAERRACQAVKLFEGRLLQLSKASAPFVETAHFRCASKWMSTLFRMRGARI